MQAVIEKPKRSFNRRKWLSVLLVMLILLALGIYFLMDAMLVCGCVYPPTPTLMP